MRGRKMISQNKEAFSIMTGMGHYFLIIYGFMTLLLIEHLFE